MSHTFYGKEKAPMKGAQHLKYPVELYTKQPIIIHVNEGCKGITISRIFF